MLARQMRIRAKFVHNAGLDVERCVQAITNYDNALPRWLNETMAGRRALLPGCLVKHSSSDDYYLNHCPRLDPQIKKTAGL